MTMYEIRYTKGGEKDRAKLMRSPYADIAKAILEQLKDDPYSNTGGGLEKDRMGQKKRKRYMPRRAPTLRRQWPAR